MIEEVWQNITSSKSKTFLAFCFCFLFGVTIASIFVDSQLDFVYFYSVVILFISLLILFWEDEKVRFFALAATFLFLGFFHYSFAFPDQNHISSYNGEEVTFKAVVDREPDVRIGKVQYITKATSVKNEDISGKVLLKTLLYPRYSYGDKLKITCELEKPEPFNGFRYDRYLANFGVFSICRRAQVDKVGKNKGNFVFSLVLDLKKRVAQQVNKLWHEPYASFMAGLLYGYRGGLGELDQLFNETGVTHIVAISGFNITIIATILITLCIHLYIPRKKAFWIITAGIILFLIFAGLSASVVRAGIMGILVLLSKQLGRSSRVFNVMILTAVLMTLENPFILIWNAGFQLSFLSTLGLVYFTPHIEEYFGFVPEFFGLRESLTSTLSAIFLTLPLILHQFGRLSIVAPVVNMMILGIIPGIMFIGFFAVIASFIYFPLGRAISWVGRLGLEYITGVVKWFADFSFASVSLPISVWSMFIIYGLMFWWLYKKNNQNNTLDS